MFKFILPSDILQPPHTQGTNSEGVRGLFLYSLVCTLTPHRCEDSTAQASFCSFNHGCGGAQSLISTEEMSLSEVLRFSVLSDTQASTFILILDSGLTSLFPPLYRLHEYRSLITVLIT